MPSKVSCQIRIMVSEGIGQGMSKSIGMGPGKAAMLRAIRETRSINAAGKQFGMSYRRAWLLVAEMNRLFTGPLVVARRGGAGGGGAEITRLGEQVLLAYAELERVVSRSSAYRSLARMIKQGSR